MANQFGMRSRLMENRLCELQIAGEPVCVTCDVRSRSM